MTPAQVAHITPPLPFAVFDEFGQGCEDRVADHYRAAVEAALRDAPQAEPVHWRALLDPAQRPQKLQTHHHVVGFTSLKACEAFVAGELDMNGWRYTVEPLYNHPPGTPSAPQQADGWVMVPAEIVNRFPEINTSNYDQDDACALNAWGVELVLAARPSAPTAVEPQAEYATAGGGFPGDHNGLKAAEKHFASKGTPL